MLEVWVKPRHNGKREQKKRLSQVVVANGNGKEGYVMSEKEIRQLISGSSGIVTIGEVAEDVWTHLGNGSGRRERFRMAERKEDRYL